MLSLPIVVVVQNWCQPADIVRGRPSTAASSCWWPNADISGADQATAKQDTCGYAGCAAAASEAETAARAEAIAFSEAFAAAETCNCNVEAAAGGFAYEEILVEAASAAATEACSSGAFCLCATWTLRGLLFVACTLSSFQHSRPEYHGNVTYYQTR